MCDKTYLLATTQQLLHEHGGAFLLRRQIDLGYRVSEQSPAGGEGQSKHDLPSRERQANSCALLFMCISRSRALTRRSSACRRFSCTG
jgi:hypothetical protein